MLSWTTNSNFQERNKPIEPPKKPEKAPFFLPTVPSISGEILFESSKLLEKEKDETSHEADIFKRVDMPPSRFLYLLYSSAEGGNCKNLCNLILSAYSLVSWFYDHSFCFFVFLFFAFWKVNSKQISNILDFNYRCNFYGLYQRTITINFGYGT